MEQEDARRFVDRWIADWNARDVEGVLAHFADDVVFTSPIADRVVKGSGGVIRGKQALRAYWTAALQDHPDLHFQLVGRYLGVDTIVINYRNQRGGLVSEALVFDGPLVVRGHATYLDG